MSETRIQVMLAEYNSLREECLQAIGFRIAVMNFTFGALAIILAAVLTSQLPRLAVGAIALLLVPTAAKAGLFIWFGEYRRSQRAGYWIRGLEHRINSELGFDALCWESQLAGRANAQTQHMSKPYVATVALILLIGYAAALVGVGYCAVGLHALGLGTAGSVIVAVALLALVISMEWVFLRYFRQVWREASSSNVSAELVSPAG